MTTGIKLTESVHPFAFLISEDSDGAGYMSRDTVTIAPSQTIVVGQILSRMAVIASVAASFSAKAGNTGNGVLALANPAVDASVKGGNYRLVFTDATHFMVEDPDGDLVDEGVVGTAFADGVKFTVSAGGTAFVAGDEFTINVDDTITDDQFVAWDGSKPAVAIAGYPATTDSSSTVQITAINAHATVRLSDLTFATGATQAQMDQAIRELAERIIKAR